jgi:hypothetical protein
VPHRPCYASTRALRPRRPAAPTSSR